MLLSSSSSHKDSLVGVPLYIHRLIIPIPRPEMPARTPSKRNPGGGGGRSNHHLVDDDLPIYGIQASPSNPISTIGPNGGFRPGSGIVPGSAGRKSSETANHNLNHLLGLRMPPRMVVGSGIGSSMSYGSSGMSGSSNAAPRRSRGIRSSFNKDSELLELGASIDGHY